MANKSYTSIPIGFRRLDNLPLEEFTLFGSLEDAKVYAKTRPIAYVGQILSVVDDGHAYVYVININRDLSLINVQGVMYEPSESPYRIEHNMDAYPSVKCIDLDGNLVGMDVDYPDRDTVIVSWNGEFHGIVVLG